MPQLPGGHVAVASLASRLSFGEDANLAATIGNSGALHASYWQKCSEQLQMGVELDANLRSKEASATIGKVLLRFFKTSNFLGFEMRIFGIHSGDSWHFKFK